MERTRHLVLLEGGRRVERRGRVRTVHGPDGEVLSACRDDGDGEACWTAGDEPVWLPEHAPDGEPLLLDVQALETERVVVSDGRFRLGGLEWWIRSDEVRAGPLSFRPTDRRPRVEPVEPGRLIARQVPGPIPPTPRHARYAVDGTERQIRSPLPLELPAEERALLRELVRTGGRGDCKVRARSAAEAARQRGLSARVVHGLAHVDGLLAPHAWVEVELPSGAVAFDPTLGQPIADATHLPLTPGELLASEVVLLEVR